MPTLEKSPPLSSTQSLLALDEGLLLESLPVGVYVCDADGRIVHYNRTAAEMWGREPDLGEPAERFCGSYRILDLKGTHIPHAQCLMAVALATGQCYRDQRIQVERPDGTQVIALVNIEVLKGEDGRVIGAVNVFRDGARFGAIPRRAAPDKLQDLEQILQALPAAIYTTDAEGRITFYNEAAVRLWGVRPQIGRSEFCGSWKLYWPDGSALPHDECPMAMALKEGRAIEGMEAVAERPDGTRVPFLACPTPLFDAAGELTGAVNMLVDMTAHKASEIATQRLAAIIETSDDAILSKNLDGVIMSWNRGAERLFGYTEQEAVGKSVTMLIPADRQDEEPEILSRIRRGDRIDHYETVRQRKDGSLIDISLSVSPIVDQNGKVVGASKIARDISDRRRAEEQKDLLITEMNHRVKNLFALSSGLVNLSGRNAESVAELVADLQERFGALARAHSLTLRQTPQSRDQETTTLHALIGTVIQPYVDQQTLAERVVITGPDLPVGSGTVTNFGLILHEFATNALKYGALALPEGQVHIECIDQGEDFCVVWREVGLLQEPVDPLQEGFGSRLARATVGGSFGGSFSREFKPDGVEIRLTAPRCRLSE